MHTISWRRTNIILWLVVVGAALVELWLLHAVTPAPLFFTAPREDIRTVLPYIGEIEYENADVQGRAFRWLPNTGDIRIIGGMHAPVVVDMHAHTGRPPTVPTQLTIMQGGRVVLATALAPGWRHLQILVPTATWYDGYATVQYRVDGQITGDRRLLGLAVDATRLQPTLLAVNVVAQWGYWVVLLVCVALLVHRIARAWLIVVGVAGVSWVIQWWWPVPWSLYGATLWAGLGWLVVACLLGSGLLQPRQRWSLLVSIAVLLLSLLALRTGMAWLGAVGAVLVWLGYRADSTPQPLVVPRVWAGALLLGATLVAMLLRVPLLDQFPQGMFRDEARHAGLAQLIGDGSRMVYSPFANLPAGYFYLSAWPIKWFGASAFAIRISAALLGSISVPLAYWALRAWWGASYALLVSIVLSTLLWHVGLSRIGFPASAGPFLTLLAVGTLWRALATPALRRSFVYAAVAGCATGGMTLGYHSTRLMPLVVVGMIIAAWYTARWSWRSRLVVLAIWGVTTVLAAFPILWYAFTESYNYMKRIDSTSITGLAHREGVPALVAVMRNIIAYLGALMIAGDGNARHFYMGMPQLTIAEGIAWLAGIVMLWRRRSADVVWLSWYLLVAVVPGILSVDAPHALRTVEATIPVAMVVAYGLWVLCDMVRQQWQMRVLVVVLVVTGCWSGVTYYQWQQDARAYAEFDGQLTRAVRTVQLNYAAAASHQAQWYLPADWRDGDVGVYMLRGMQVGHYDAGMREPPTARTQLLVLPQDVAAPADAVALTVPASLRAHDDLRVWCLGGCDDMQWIR